MSIGRKFSIGIGMINIQVLLLSIMASLEHPSEHSLEPPSEHTLITIKHVKSNVLEQLWQFSNVLKHL